MESVIVPVKVIFACSAIFISSTHLTVGSTLGLLVAYGLHKNRALSSRTCTPGSTTPHANSCTCKDAQTTLPQ